MTSFYKPRGISTIERTNWDNASTSITTGTLSGSISATNFTMVNSTIVTSVTGSGQFVTFVVNGSSMAFEVFKY